jgi:hypothetical protein
MSRAMKEVIFLCMGRLHPNEPDLGGILKENVKIQGGIEARARILSGSILLGDFLHMAATPRKCGAAPPRNLPVTSATEELRLARR